MGTRRVIIDCNGSGVNRQLVDAIIEASQMQEVENAFVLTEPGTQSELYTDAVSHPR